jgi:TP901 family phage tail tape measure protein
MSSVFGYSVLQIIPSLAGAGAAMQAQLGGIMPPVGAAAGQSLGQRMATGLAGTGAAMMTAGKSLTGFVTLPILGAGLAVLSASGNFEQGMNKVRALSGATGKDFDSLKTQAMDLGRTTKFSATEAADAMGFLAMAGFKTTDIIGAMPSVLQLASSANLDLGRAADITSNILTGYGMNVSELGGANDVLVKAFTSANVNLEQLGEAFKYVGPVAKGAGVSFTDSAAAIALMGNAGIQGSMAGTSLRQAIVAMINPTKQQSDVMKRLGLDVLDASGNLRPLDVILGQLETSGASTADIMQLFGVRAGPAMAALVDQGSDALKNMSASLSDSGGIAEQIARVQMEGFKGSLTAAKSALEGMFIAIGESGVLATMTGLVDKVTGGLRRLTEVSPETLRLITQIGLVVGAAGPGLLILGAAFKMAGAAILVLTSPMTLVVLGVAALTAGLVYAYQNSEQFRAVIAQVAAFITGTVVPALGVLVDYLRVKIGEAVAYVVEVWPQISKTIGTVMDAIATNIGTVLGVIQGAWSIFGGTILSFISSTFENIKTVIGGVLKVIGGIVNVFVGVLTGDWSRAWDGIKSIVSGVLTVIKGIIGQAFDIIKTVFRLAWDAIKAGVSAAWDGIKSIVSGGIDRVKDAIGRLGEIPGKVREFFDRAKVAAGEALGGLVSTVAGIPGRVLGALGDLGGLLSGAGRDVIDGFIKGITGAFQRVRDTLGRLTGLLPDWKGPPGRDASILFGAGQLVMGGFEQGLRSSFGDVRRTLADATDLLGMHFGPTDFAMTRLAGPAPSFVPPPPASPPSGLAALAGGGAAQASSATDDLLLEVLDELRAFHGTTKAIPRDLQMRRRQNGQNGG